MKLIKLQRITKKNKSKEIKDRRQNNRLFNRSYRGGLPKNIIEAHKALTTKTA